MARIPMTMLKPFIALLLGLGFTGMVLTSQKKQTLKTAGDPELAKKIARFAPTVLTANTTRLSSNDRLALKKIIEASKLLDPLFLTQVWSGNEALEKKLQADKTVVGRQRLHYFYINDGPWSRLDNNEPFIEGVPHEKPPQANYYPDDISKEEFESWLQGLSAEEKEKATGYFYVIRRDANRQLV